MIITPHIFSQATKRLFFSSVFFGSKSSFRIPPKPRKAIFMIVLFVGILSFIIFCQKIDMIPRSYSCSGIKVNCTSSLSSVDNQRFYLNIRRNPDLGFTSSTRNSKYRGFGDSIATFGFVPLLAASLVFSLAVRMGFINFNRNTKDCGHIFTHLPVCHGQNTIGSQTTNSSFATGCLAAEVIVIKQPFEKISSLLLAQTQRKPSTKTPFVFAVRASMFSSENLIDFFREYFGQLFWFFMPPYRIPAAN